MHSGRLVYCMKNNGRQFRFDEVFKNASPAVLTGERQEEMQVSFYQGNDPAAWIDHVQATQTVSLGELWQGIGVRLTAYGNNIEKLFEVSAGADVSSIRIAVEGIQGIYRTKEGELLLRNQSGKLSFTKPLAWQVIGNQKVAVDIRYDVIDRKTYGFAVGRYDRSQTLYIDPLLASTYLGGSSREDALSVATDSRGNVYVTGHTNSMNFPVPGTGYDRVANGATDVFVAKFNHDLSVLLAATYIGGSRRDAGCEVKVDAAGNIVVSGYTESANFPVTLNAYDRTWNQGYDVFVCKLSGDLQQLLASTFIGGSGHESNNRMAINDAGDVFVAGNTTSANFPVTSSAYDQSANGALPGYVFRLSSNLASLTASTFLGGRESDLVEGIFIHRSGDVFVAGTASSPDFPVTATAYGRTLNGSSDMFISRLSNDLGTLNASTLIGGNSGETAAGISGDASGNIYVCGITHSADFPVSGNAYDQALNGGGDLVVARLDASLTTLHAATYVGGSADESKGIIFCDRSGNICVAGETFSPDFPVTHHHGAGAGAANRDVVVVVLDGNLSGLITSFMIGGLPASPGAGMYEEVYSIADDSAGNIFICGVTSSADFPVTTLAYDNSYNNGFDSYVTKLSYAGRKRVALDPVNKKTCVNDSLLLEARVIGTAYEWNVGTVHPQLYVKDPGWYVCEITTADTIYIDSVFVEHQHAEIAVHPLVRICSGATADLASSETGADSKYLWSTGDTSAVIRVAAPGHYYVFAQNALHCGYIDSFHVSVVQPVPLRLAGDTAVCAGQKIVIDVTDPFYTRYRWSPGEHTPSIEIQDEGLYTVEASNDICSFTGSIRVRHHKLPYLDLPKDTVVCFDELEAILLSAPQHYTSYSWYPTGETTYSIYAEKAALYRVDVADSNGCMNSDTTLVDELCESAVWVPNAFSPNGDGVNDFFELRTRYVAGLSISVYNRWGELVYFSSSLPVRWDGSYNGQPLAADVYVYRIGYVTLSKKIRKSLNGTVTLIR